MRSRRALEDPAAPGFDLLGGVRPTMGKTPPHQENCLAFEAYGLDRVPPGRIEYQPQLRAMREPPDRQATANSLLRRRRRIASHCSSQRLQPERGRQDPLNALKHATRGLELHSLSRQSSSQSVLVDPLHNQYTLRSAAISANASPAAPLVRLVGLATAEPIEDSGPQSAHKSIGTTSCLRRSPAVTSMRYA